MLDDGIVSHLGAGRVEWSDMGSIMDKNCDSNNDVGTAVVSEVAAADEGVGLGVGTR